MTIKHSVQADSRWATARRVKERTPSTDASNAIHIPAAELSTLRKVFNQDSRAQAVAKRTFDLVCASTLLILLSPVLLFIAIISSLQFRAAPFFLHERVGRGGPQFKCLKFRTMRDPRPGEEAKLHPSFKAGVDTRTTALTRILRKTSLDELPQLLNVLRGDMSLVGPRPVVIDELRLHFGELAPVLLTAKPGMTGLWTVSGRSCVDYPERALIELRYATRASIWLDMRILVKTIFTVMGRKGAL